MVAKANMMTSCPWGHQELHVGVMGAVLEADLPLCMDTCTGVKKVQRDTAPLHVLLPP